MLKQLINIFQRRQAAQVGTDLVGNRYFEAPPKPGTSRPQRTVILKDRDWREYDEHTIPVQWSAWLRGTRLDAPTIEELEMDMQRRQRLTMMTQQQQQQLQQNQHQKQPEKPIDSLPKPEPLPKGPSEAFQPESWNPDMKPKRRS